MALVIGGLLLSLVLYLAAIYGIAWSASRRVREFEGPSVSARKSPEFPRMHEIWVRHSVEWLVGFFVFFLILGLTDFPLWQRLGLGAVFALFLGSIWFDQSGRNPNKGLPRYRRGMSNAWYLLLAVTDWLGFMWVLCFSSALAIEVIQVI